jgi:hypothetical protein
LTITRLNRCQAAMEQGASGQSPTRRPVVRNHKLCIRALVSKYLGVPA